MTTNERTQLVENLKNALPMIALEGSEKQIAWAEEIRDNYIHSVIEAAGSEHDFVIYEHYLGWLLKTQPTAKWWIDNRSNHRLTREMMATYGRYCMANEPETWKILTTR